MLTRGKVVAPGLGRLSVTRTHPDAFAIDHDRREIRHFGIAEHPTSFRVIQPRREPFPSDAAPRLPIFDDDSIFSARVADSIQNAGIEPRRTAFRSPSQNGIAERWIGSGRRELLDHVIGLASACGIHILESSGHSRNHRSGFESS